MQTIFGQPSYTLANRQVRAAVTQTGGHLGPVSFRIGDKTIAPLAVAPWWNEKLPAGTLPLIRGLLDSADQDRDLLDKVRAVEHPEMVGRRARCLGRD